jgi:hypothetical protein
MAKKVTVYKNPSAVSGKLIDDLLNMELYTFNTMTKSELKLVVSRLASAANKRMRRMEKSGKTTAAYEAATKSGGDFSVKGKDLNALRVEYVRAKAFLTDPHGSLVKTSTSEGEARVSKHTRELLEAHGIKSDDSDKITDIFRVLERIKKKDRKYANNQMKYRVLQEASMLVDEGKTVNEAYDALEKELDQLYEEEIEKSETVSPSDFYNID